MVGLAASLNEKLTGAVQSLIDETARSTPWEQRAALAGPQLAGGSCMYCRTAGRARNEELVTPRRLSLIAAALHIAFLTGCDSRTSNAADPQLISAGRGGRHRRRAFVVRSARLVRAPWCRMGRRPLNAGCA
jgi:hypothetical protein